ncbi:MAG: 30S ribosome-binding factor RbfA [Ekhidna sp.]|nr:30S ribosome-binding factor RbfA [Ekhidna sp.]
MESQRQAKYGKQIQKDLAEIFQKDAAYFFKTSLGTITHVSMSPDLGLARIFISILPISKAEIIFNHLNEIKSEIRNKLGQKIRNRTRIIPELAFFHDDTEEKASKMNRLIDNLNIPPNKEA